MIFEIISGKPIVTRLKPTERLRTRMTGQMMRNRKILVVPVVESKESGKG